LQVPVGVQEATVRTKVRSCRISGDEVLEGGSGDLVFKPRGQWHTFWNASDYPTRILEIIAPACLEQFFDRLSGMGRVTAAPPETLGALCAAYAP